MSDTATSAYLDRFKAREKFVGDDGGIFTLRPLRPSEAFKLRDMLQGADAGTFNVYAAIAGVCQFNDSPLAFPKDRREIEWLVDKIGYNGIGAMTAAFNKLHAPEAAPEPETEAETDAA